MTFFLGGGGGGARARQKSPPQVLVKSLFLFFLFFFVLAFPLLPVFKSFEQLPENFSTFRRTGEFEQRRLLATKTCSVVSEMFRIFHIKRGRKSLRSVHVVGIKNSEKNKKIKIATARICSGDLLFTRQAL